MKTLLNILNELCEQRIRYDISNEEDQLRITFEKTEDYIVITEDSLVHANNINNLNWVQTMDLIRSVGLRSRS